MKTANTDPKQNQANELPDPLSPLWHKGFIWKKVFFKLYSKKQAGKVKKEVKALKHIAIEYLQTENTLKVNDPQN